jgi:hypothetical protein
MGVQPISFYLIARSRQDPDLFRLGPEDANDEILSNPMRAKNSKWIWMGSSEEDAELISGQT